MEIVYRFSAQTTSRTANFIGKADKLSMLITGGRHVEKLLSTSVSTVKFSTYMPKSCKIAEKSVENHVESVESLPCNPLLYKVVSVASHSPISFIGFPM